MTYMEKILIKGEGGGSLTKRGGFTKGKKKKKKYLQYFKKGDRVKGAGTCIRYCRVRACSVSF